MAFTNGTDLVSLCNTASFTYPEVFGAEFSSLTAEPIIGLYENISELVYVNNPTTALTNTTFCNVTLTYTHPGMGDFISVGSYLPISSPAWNGRLQSIGGGGWVAGGPATEYGAAYGMLGAVGSGYSSVTSDAGVSTDGVNDATPWALTSEGNVNVNNLRNLGSQALFDEKVIVDSLMKQFYGREAEYSYWSGCSQGGRQGMMLAQRYPDLYDGYAASAPAINWSPFFATMTWPQIFVNAYLDGVTPPDCEVVQITNLAVQVCDPLDGVTDGVISNVDGCYAAFNPFDHVGTSFVCSETNQTATISREAALVANATWTGPRTSDGEFMWYGPQIGAAIAGPDAKEGATYLGNQWLNYFVAKSLNYDVANASLAEYEKLFALGLAEFDSIIGTASPDLSELKKLGGKIVSFHGTADNLIPTRGSEQYWHRVSETTSGGESNDDFYRLFEVPGLGHCGWGIDGIPTEVFAALVDWVENDIAPETIPFSFTATDGTENERLLCKYPIKAATYDGVGDTTLQSSYSCV